MKGDRQRIQLADQLLSEGVLHPEPDVPAQDAEPGLKPGPGELEDDQARHDHGQTADPGAAPHLVEEIFHNERIDRAECGEDEGQRYDTREWAPVRADKLQGPPGELKSVPWHRGRERVDTLASKFDAL